MEVAIMSHNRHHTIGSKTLALLDKENFEPSRVTIFVHDKHQKKLYEDYNDSKWKVVVGATTYTDQYNHIINHYDEGTEVLFFDDDINGFMLHPEAEEGYKGMKDFAQTAFKENQKVGCYLWGLYPSANKFFLQNTVTYNLNLIIGQFYGMIIRHGNWITVPMKTDYELTIKHFLRDGMVCRYNWIASQSKVYSGKGGLQDTDRQSLSEVGAKLLLDWYPTLVRKKKSASKFFEISLVKPKA